jgi:short-subunit dehydrogenase
LNEYFKGKYVLVTGAAGALGQAVALQLGQYGAHLILLDQNLGKLEQLDDQLHQHNVVTTLIPCDVADIDKHDMLSRSLAERFGKLDGWVSCAAEFSALQPILHLPISQWQKEITVNVTANLKLLQVLTPLLQHAAHGRVVFTVDTSINEPQAYWGSYAISQQMLSSIVRLYREENPSSSVQVNLFDPGPFASSIRSKAFPGENPNVYPDVNHIAEELIGLLRAECQISGEMRKFENIRNHLKAS